MISSLVLLSILAAPPVDAFVNRYPGASTLAAGEAGRFVHASGFRFDPVARRPEAAARAFLDLHGAAFGVTPRQTLVVKHSPPPGEVGGVRFERRIDGLPVLGGDLVVGVDAQNRVFVVNGGDVPPAVSGRHTLGEVEARSAALSSFGRVVSGAGTVSVVKGWRAFGSELRAVHRVDFIAQEPAGDWRVFVDGETGTMLFREDLRYQASAPGFAFEVSPVETAASLCPLSGAAATFCASPVSLTLPNLVTGSDLAGSQTTVFDCNGANAPASAVDVPGPCASVVAADGAFDFPVDSTYRSTTDDFAAVMAYYHLDKHVSYLKSLDPSLPVGGAGRALTGSLPGLVNAFQGGAPMDNAFFSPILDAMVFGQGTNADFAYDATVIYHEFNHGAVSAWGGFAPTIDALGGLDEPGALNEGTADALAASVNGRSEVGAFMGATATPATIALRDMDDPGASRTCQGDGTLVNQFGTTTPFFLNGLDGEVHDDGEIWNGFYWEIYQGLAAAGLKGCSGLCEAGPALQYEAVQLAAGAAPTFSSYWQTLKSAAAALFPPESGAAAYVDCVARRRKLDTCDRTVPVYAGERKAQFIRLRFSPFQTVLHATGLPQFSVCSAFGTTTTVYVRRGLPVQINPANGAVTAADGAATFAQACSNGMTTFALNAAGNWYLLFDSPAALVGANPGRDVFRIDASFTGMASRPASAPPPTCVPPFLTIAPASPVVPPRGGVAFSASGGSGAGYAWSLATNASGGSITPAGVYTAGPAGSVTDVVQVIDSLGNTDTRSVTITAGVSILPATASAPPRGVVNFTATGGSGTGFTWSLTTSASGGSLTPTGVYTAGSTGSVTDVLQVTDSLGNVDTRSVAVTAGVSIAPATASTPRGGSITFTASGGSGTGFTWSLTTNASGGSITPTGVYTAGPTGSVTDVVQARDSLGNTDTRSITVTAGLSISPATPSTLPGGSLTFTASGGSGTGFAWSLTTNASGGSITPAGVYTAGPTGGVTDVVRVDDSLGNTAAASVTVTGASPGGGEKSGGGCGCGASSGATSLLALSVVALLRRRRQGAESEEAHR